MGDNHLLDCGDEIEVAFVTQNGNTIWNPAKLVRFVDHHVVVRFPSGEEKNLPKGQGKYRRPL